MCCCAACLSNAVAVACLWEPVGICIPFVGNSGCKALPRFLHPLPTDGGMSYVSAAQFQLPQLLRLIRFALQDKLPDELALPFVVLQLQGSC